MYTFLKNMPCSKRVKNYVINIKVIMTIVDPERAKVKHWSARGENDVHVRQAQVFCSYNMILIKLKPGQNRLCFLFLFHLILALGSKKESEFSIETERVI